MGSTTSPVADAHFLVVPDDGTVAADHKRRLWARLSPLQRALLATDGSFTLLLSALAGEAIRAELVYQRRVVSAGRHAHLGVAPDCEVIERTVTLSTAATRRPVAYATSVIVPDRLPIQIRRRLEETDDPIGLVLRWQRLETFRELSDWGTCSAEDTPRIFTARSVFFRTYTIHALGEPCMEITEYFADGS